MRRQNKFPIKSVLIALLIVLLGVMIYNSGVLVKIGLLKSGIPEDIGIRPDDPRVIEKVDESVDRGLVRRTVDELMGLITGKVKEGSIVIVTNDTAKTWGVEDMTFEIKNAVTGEVLEQVVTNSEGVAKSSPLKYKRAYEIRQIATAFPYESSDETIVLEMKSPIMEIKFEQRVEEQVKKYERDSNGNINVIEAFVPVELIFQKPELPNGCEITSLTSALNYNGYDIDKVTLSDEFLPMRPFYRKDGKLFGPHPDEAFSGNPRDGSGFYVFAGPTAKAGNDYIKSVNGDHAIKDLTGSSREAIIEYVKQGVPVVIWVTLELNPPNFNYSWQLENTGVEYKALLNLHSVLINGINGDQFNVMDPLKGNVEYDVTKLFESYESIGSRALVVLPLDN
ncbi:MAG: C39 family peptidase [Clostridia bacterium]|nr:C39 family peptidase [Clostridia bacterium]